MKGLLVAVLLAMGCDGVGTFPPAKPATPTTPASAPPAAAPPTGPPPAPSAAPLEPRYTLFVDSARLAATNQGAAWCGDGVTPDVRVTVALGLVRATTGASPGLDASFGAPLVRATEEDFASGFALAVEASCAGQPFFTAGSAQVTPTRADIEYGALELDTVGAVDQLRLHFTLGYGGGGGAGGDDDASGGGSDDTSSSVGGGADWSAGGDAAGGAVASGDDSGATTGGGDDGVGGADATGASDGGDSSGSWVDTTSDDGGSGDDATSADDGSAADDGASTDDCGCDDGSSNDGGTIDDFARRPRHAIKRVAKDRRSQRRVLRTLGY